MSAHRLALAAPLAGWSTPLEEVPDEVFAGRMLGDGLAIDPTADTLHAPCDAEVIVIAAAHHALTLRTEQGCEILLHVGLDSVALNGTGFEMLARLNTRVRAGEPLLRFNLDYLAQHARSLLTPVIIGLDSGFRITRRTLQRSLRAGDFLMEVEAAGVPGGIAAAGAPAHEVTARIAVALAHGLHARPAAVLVGALRNLDAQVRIAAHGREANARSTVALMGLGVSHGEEVEVRASGKRRTARPRGGEARPHARGIRRAPCARPAGHRCAAGCARGPARRRTGGGDRQPRLRRRPGGAAAARAGQQRRSRARGSRWNRPRWRAPVPRCASAWRAVPAARQPAMRPARLRTRTLNCWRTRNCCRLRRC